MEDSAVLFKDGMMLEVQSLRKQFSHVNVLDGIEFTVSQREVVYLLGRSGVGKSVLLRLMVGLIPFDAGEVILNGECIDFQDPKAVLRLRSQVGLVFQKPALLDYLTLEENLLFGMKERPSNLLQMVRSIGISEKDLTKSVQDSSFGMQKKTSVLRAILRNPKFLLFDEPTTGLDPISTEAMNRLMLVAIKESGAGTLVVSHDIKSALQYADRILLMDRARIVFNGTPAQFRSSTQKTVGAFLCFEH